MQQCSIGILAKYLQLHKESIITDNRFFTIIEFNTFEDFNELLPDEIIEMEFIDYSMTYKHDNTIRKESYHEDIAVYQSFENTMGIIRVTLNKVKMIDVYANRKENVYFYLNFNNFVADYHLIDNINQEYKFNLLVLDDIPLIENQFLIVTSLNKIHECVSTLLEGKSSGLINEINVTFDNARVEKYFDLPHFWSFSSDEKFLLPLKYRAITTFINLISNKLIRKNEYEEVFLIKGHHSLEFKTPVNSDLHSSTQQIVQSNIFCEIINFTLDEKRHLDKLLITRNVLTTYLDNTSSLNVLNEQIDKIYSTIKHHFELYIRNEVKIFIDQKNQLLKETLDITKQISKNTAELSNNIRTIIFTFIISIIAVLIPNVLKVKFSSDLVYTFVILYLFFLFVNLYLGVKIKRQHINTLSNLKNYIEFSSMQSNTGLDYKNLYEKFLKNEEENFLSIYDFYRVLLYVVSLVGIALLLN